jgi:hypothetical protein
MFPSTAIMAQGVAPEWIQTASSYNPVNWAVIAARESPAASPDRGTVRANIGEPAAVALVLGHLGTRAFGSCQRSLWESDAGAPAESPSGVLPRELGRRSPGVPTGRSR